MAQRFELGEVTDGEGKPLSSAGFIEIYDDSVSAGDPVCDVEVRGVGAPKIAVQIAALPELRTALQNTLSLLKAFTSDSDAVAKAVRAEAEAALAKAAT